MTRSEKAILNTATALIYELVAAICGLIIPRLMLKAFGSELYGATTSITYFLSYITLLQAGVGGVARAALYKPLSTKSNGELKNVLGSVQNFFQKITYIYIAYVVIVAIFYNEIANDITIEWGITAALTIIISFSSLAQYYFGITYSILVNADQRNYINTILSIVTTALNTVLVYVLVFLKCDIVIVKIASSLIFVLKPLALKTYASRHYKLGRIKYKKGENYLPQKWSALGQHIAYFLHSNTDVAVLTVSIGVVEVAVYSIYHLVVCSLKKIVVSFTGGMEAAFGNMIAKKEDTVLRDNFEIMELINSFITTALFTTAGIMLLPFVGLYTKDITDVDYIRPAFGTIFLIAEAVYCLRQPYYKLVTAAGHFKQTTVAAWVETGLNVILSAALVWKFGIISVAIGTLVAMIFRTIYYAFYLSHEILCRKVFYFFKRQIITILNVIVIVLITKPIVSQVAFNSYTIWILYAFIVTLIAAVVILLLNYLFYKRITLLLIRKVYTLIRKRFNRNS